MPQFKLSHTICVALLATLGSMANVGKAEEIKKPPADDAKALIDQLTQLGRQDTGYSATVSGSSFLPLGQSHAGAMLLFQKPNEPSDALRSLVKLGIKALSTLIEHLEDDRPTKIVLKHQGFVGGMFSARDIEEPK